MIVPMSTIICVFLFQCELNKFDCRKEKEKIELPEGIKSKGPKKQVRPSPPLTRRNSEDKVSASHFERLSQVLLELFD